jgi:hypothetical protein
MPRKIEGGRSNCLIKDTCSLQIGPWYTDTPSARGYLVFEVDFEVSNRGNACAGCRRRTEKGSFARSYPLSRQSRAGMADRDGKKGPPNLFGVTWKSCRRKVAISVSLRIFAANIPTIRACVAGDGW